MASDFKTYLASEVKRIGKREKLNDDKAFLFWFATNILDLSEDDAREATSVEGANDKSIDLFWVDDDEGRVIVGQGKYSSDFQIRPTIGQVSKLASSLHWLANPEALRRDGKSDLAQSAEDYLKAINDGYGVELWFVYAGPKCPNVEKHISVYNQDSDNLSKRRAYRHYHIGMLQDTWEELEGASQRIESETVSILSEKVLPFEGTFGKACIATVPATEIVRLYTKYEESLFDRNIRLFLGVRKGSVNAGMAETLSNKKECPNFWAYNNGITIICDSFYPSKSKVKLSNFSIVNGCQTAVSLALGPEDPLGDVSVLVRFIAASAEIVDDVIRFTNSQNPIRTWDIASQDKTQRRLKTDFTRLSKPYIYLTRRGARPKGDLRKFRENGKLRQMRIDIIGQYASAFRGEPVLAYKHKSFIFSKFHDDIFPPDVQAEEVLFQWICGEVCKETVKASIAKRKDEEVRILKKGGTLFVTAVISRILSLRNGATYLKGASEYTIASKATRIRLQKYSEYARDKYVQAVLDQAAIDKEELPTLIRSKDFYKRVIERIERVYAADARASKWLSEALPPFNLSVKG